MKMIVAFVSVTTLIAGLTVCAKEGPQVPIPVRVVVVTIFEIGEDTGDTAGKFQNWVERLPLPVVLPFPQGYHNLRHNSEKQVLGIVNEEGPSRMASSITALASDKRFDFRNAYWIQNEIAGVDPNLASLASSAWARHVVDGDLAYEIDARKIPSQRSTGYVPFGRGVPFQSPRPPATSERGTNEFALNTNLADWAFRLSTERVKLADDRNLQHLRAGYNEFAKAQQPPSIIERDILAASTFWTGSQLNRWAEQWASYWSDGKAQFAMGVEKDATFMQAPAFLSQVHTVDINRVMIVRSASNFTAPAPGQTSAKLLGAIENHSEPSALMESTTSAFDTTSVVVNELARNWSIYRNRIPPMINLDC